MAFRNALLPNLHPKKPYHSLVIIFEFHATHFLISNSNIFTYPVHGMKSQTIIVAPHNHQKERCCCRFNIPIKYTKKVYELCITFE